MTLRARIGEEKEGGERGVKVKTLSHDDHPGRAIAVGGRKGPAVIAIKAKQTLAVSVVSKIYCQCHVNVS